MTTRTQYFDSNALADGDGSIERPKNTDEAFNAFLREDGYKTLYVKAGSVFRRTVPFNSGKCWVPVLAYGDGDTPRILSEVFEIVKTYHINSAA